MSATQDTTTRPGLYRAVRHLAGICDGARARDGHGYNGIDTGFGHELAALPAESWTPRMQAAAWRMIQKYRVQLAHGGIDVEAIPRPAAPPAAQSAQVALAADGRLSIRFPYDRELVDAVKREVPGARWDREARVWLAPPSRAAMDFAGTRGMAISADAVTAALAAPPAPVDAPPPAPAPAGRSVAWSPDRTSFVLRFPYDLEMVAAVKRDVPGRRWDGVARCWTAPGASAPAVIAFATAHDFALPPDLAEELQRQQRERETRRVASAAQDADYDVPGLGITLLPFQRAGVRYAVDAKRTFIADEPGLGKTFQAVAAVLAVQAFPALAIVPASLRLNWRKEVRRALPGATIEILNGRPGRYDADFTIINYEMLGRHQDALLARGHRAVIIDEAHYVKNRRAARTRNALAIASTAEYRFLLTGTPVMNRPSELAAPLEVLGRLDEFGGWWGFMRRYAGAYRDRYGWQTGGATNLQELNAALRERCFLRRRKVDVLTELPPKRRATVPVALTNRAEYRRAEDDLIRWLGQHAERDGDFLASIAHLPVEQQERERRARRATAEATARRAEQLVRVNALKQLAARGKLDAVKQWVTEFLEGTDEKVIVFAYHVAIQQALAEAFPGCARLAGGASQSGAQQEAEKARFMTDPACRVIVCSLTAGGLGHTLTAASNVAMVEQAWTPAAHDQAEDRAHRIGQHDSVTAWYLLAEGTIDDDIAELLAAKRAVVDAATDGVLDDEADPAILDELVERLISGAPR